MHANLFQTSVGKTQQNDDLVVIYSTRSLHLNTARCLSCLPQFPGGGLTRIVWSLPLIVVGESVQEARICKLGAWNVESEQQATCFSFRGGCWSSVFFPNGDGHRARGVRGNNLASARSAGQNKKCSVCVFSPIPRWWKNACKWLWTSINAQ